MPDDGAGGTSGAVRGSTSGGKGAWCIIWAPGRAPPRVPLARPTVDDAEGAPPGRPLAMADVDRMPDGRLDDVSLPLPADESLRSRAVEAVLMVLRVLMVVEDCMLSRPSGNVVLGCL